MSRPDDGIPARARGVPRPDRYEERGLLGSGSSGMVFRVRDRELGKEVALKTLVSADPADVLQLKREFRALERFVHPNLAQLYDLEVSDEGGYFTMELIEGANLLEALCGRPPRPATDDDAVREAFAQLAAGLMQLHAADKLHRDVKPMNVIVEPEGRVVLLDYGLVTRMDHKLSVASQRAGMAGTLLYMSPEQAWGQPIRPAADWYSVGVMLYECLSGHPPFEGPGLGALLDRQHRPPRPLEELVPDVSADLAGLAADLLSYDPERRPTGAQVLARLRGEPEPSPQKKRTRRAPRAVFVGRREEKAQLRRAYEATRRGRPSLVRVDGPSGIGKSTLVETFLSELERTEDALVLRCRCHPQESVRFDAVDGWVDDLARFLNLCPAEERAILRPDGVPALTHVFPVLGGVDFGSLDREMEPSEADPLEVRRRAFSAMRQLLGRIALRRPLALWADDVQWGDRDSASFLLALLRGDDPPPLMLVLSCRDDENPSLLLSELANEEVRDALPRLDRIRLAPLSPEQATQLLEALMDGVVEGLSDRSRALATEAGGSPFFLGELARYLREAGGQAAERGDELGDVVRERMRGLTDDARRVLEVVAVAGRPLATRVALRVAGLGESGRPSVYGMCRTSWLRAGSSGDLLDTYHARFREAVTDGLDPDTLRALHRDLAAALAETEKPDGAEVLEHWVSAGDTARAADWAVDAADQASKALAFDGAAALYEQAFHLRGEQDADWKLLEQRGHALSRAGRGALAASAYANAAQAAAGAGVTGFEALELRGLSAQQHLFAGELERGTKILRGVLDELGIRVAKGPSGAIRSALRHRLRFVLRQASRRALGRPLFRERERADLEPVAVRRLDILSGAARGLSMLDFTLADALNARYLMETLEIGEPSRALRALGMEASIEGTVGGRWFRGRAVALLDTVDSLARQTRDPYDAALVLLYRSNVAWFSAEWRRCVELGDQARDLLHSHCIGINWELSVNHVVTTSALVQQGRIRELRERLPGLLEDARSRGDTFGLQAFRNGDTILLQLAADDPAEAQAQLDAAQGRTATGPLRSGAYTYLMGVVQIQLYSGEAAAGWRRLDESWRALRRSGFLRLDGVAVGLYSLRGRAAAAAAAQLPEGDSERARLARIAHDAARGVSRSSLPHVPGLAAVLQACEAGLRADRDACALQLEAAVAAFERVDMRLQAESVRWQLGRIVGGDGGREAIVSAEAWMRSEGVRHPEAMAHMFAPIGLHSG